MHEQSVIETRQSKAEDSYFFTSKKSYLRQDLNPQLTTYTRQMLYQLSYRGSPAGQAESLNVMQMQGCLSLITQRVVHAYKVRCVGPVL